MKHQDVAILLKVCLNPPKKSYVSINEIIEHTIKLLKNQVAFKDIQIIRKISSNMPQINLDKDKIKQVFWNLMINASEAMPRGGTLTISSNLSKDKKYIETSFEDDGVGIPEENIKKLFDPFFTTKGVGTGLGLAVSYGIIKQHQGKIKVKSDPGQGSVFTILLPLTE